MMTTRGNTYISKVQRGVDLVHDVQGRGAVDVECENEREGAERLLAAGQVADVLPALLWRHHAEQDPFGEGVEAVDEFELGIAS